MVKNWQKFNENNDSPKPLIEFRYSSEEAFFKYLKTKDLEQLQSDLKRIEDLAKEKYGNGDKSLWFKFTSDDTLATTINDIMSALYLPIKQSDHTLMLDKLKEAIDLNSEIRVYYS